MKSHLLVLTASGSLGFASLSMSGWPNSFQEEWQVFTEGQIFYQTVKKMARTLRHF